MEKTKQKNIGIKVPQPKETCEDKHCPFHGGLKVRGRVLTGNIIKTDVSKTATFVFERSHYIQKYERYEKRFTKLRVHNPSCINAKSGDHVKIVECRPISKTKKFVIIEILGGNK